MVRSIIRAEQALELDGKDYYPSRTGFTSNKSVVQNILTKKIDENEDDDINVTEFI